MTKEDLLNKTAKFTWMFCHQFFLETDSGNYVWSDPDYFGGNNSITSFAGSYAQFANGQLGRDKGTHIISEYCGTDFSFESAD